MLLTSSGSNVSLIAVKPDMSANITVTCFLADASSGEGTSDVLAVWAESSETLDNNVGRIGCVEITTPQSPQKRSSFSVGKPQRWQNM